MMKFLLLTSILLLIPQSTYSLSSSDPVLVVGATGRVGQRVVRQLMDRGIPVRALVRNVTKAQEVLDPSVTCYAADLGHYDRDEAVMEEAVKGSKYIISVSGVVRFSKWTDFLPWRFMTPRPTWAGRDHPYYGNYLGQKKLVQLAEKYDVQRFVRLTGLALAYSPFNPVALLFNSLLSVSNRFNTMFEQELWDSNVPFIILRPGGLAEEPRNTTSTNLQIEPSGILPFPSRVGRSDVASLAIEACNLASDKSYTVACRWCGDAKPRPQGVKEDGFGTAKECWDELVASGKTSPGRPPLKPFRLAVGIAAYTFFFLLGKAAISIGKAIASFKLFAK